jgi:4-hydroxy-3-polyprenylbenzoate decarboxylase
VDWTRDLHFQTRTTIDTLDYSGEGWNAGSKLVIACRGEKKRALTSEIPANLRLPTGFSEPFYCLPGILAIKGPAYASQTAGAADAESLCRALEGADLAGTPLILIVDDSRFTAATLNNFVWTAFTRSNPSHDVYGIDSFTEFKHWGCRGPLVMDARKKPHHAPELTPDPEVVKRVDQLLSAYKF